MAWTLRGCLWCLRGAICRRFSSCRSVVSYVILIAIGIIILSAVNITLFEGHGELKPEIFSNLIGYSVQPEGTELSEDKDNFDYTDYGGLSKPNEKVNSPSKVSHMKTRKKKKKPGTKGKVKAKSKPIQPLYGKKDDIGSRKDKLMFRRSDLKNLKKKNPLPLRNKPKSGPQNYQEDAVVGDQMEWNLQIEQERRRELRQRSLQVQRECDKDVRHKLGRRLNMVYEHLNWVTRYDLIWCPIFKAGSTTWMKNLLLLAGETRFNGSLHQKASRLYPVPTSHPRQQNLLDKSLKFMIVRHPFDRLLSAYRDKMLRTLKTDDPYRRLQLFILDKYKDVGSTGNSSRTEEKDEENETENKRERILGEEAVDVTTKKHTDHPSFLQFLYKVRDDLKFFWKVMDGTLVDAHWTPYWYSCAPCQIHYDIIAKVETLNLDQEFIIRAANLQGVLLNARTHASSFDGYTDTESAAVQYFSQIPVHLLKELEELFRPDFKLYGYTSDKYLDMAKFSV